MLYPSLTIYDHETLEFIETIEECTEISIRDNILRVYYLDDKTNEEHFKRIIMKDKYFKIY